MQVIFQSRHQDGQSLRAAAVSRVRFALRRLSTLVPRARVQLSDVNGPRGGLDKRCQVELRSEGAAPVVITALARDWRTALDLALGRATQALTRQLRRQHARGRQRGAALSLAAQPQA